MTIEPTGMTVQLYVGEIGAARDWFSSLFGRKPDFQPRDDFAEWQFRPGSWEIHVVEGEPASSQRAYLRFGVSDIAATRTRLAEEGVEVSEVEELPDVVRWCNFDDPWGNRLGLYQDLSRWP